MRFAAIIARSDQNETDGTQPDRALVARIARQDQAAMKALMARYQVRIFRFVIRFVHNRDVAEDVVRDTFFAAWQCAHRFENRSAVSTWLLGIARNKALSARQRLGAPPEPLTDALEATLVDPAELPDLSIEREQTIVRLRQCLAMLPPSDGALFDLVYYHEKSLREVAEIMEVPVNTVKTRMLRARKRLAALLMREEESTRDEIWEASPTLQPQGRDGFAPNATSRRLAARPV
jgi:RNA polymerase sigma-70 factor (ECF subfamily)